MEKEHENGEREGRKEGTPAFQRIKSPEPPSHDASPSACLWVRGRGSGIYHACAATLLRRSPNSQPPATPMRWRPCLGRSGPCLRQQENHRPSPQKGDRSSSASNAELLASLCSLKLSPPFSHPVAARSARRGCVPPPGRHSLWLHKFPASQEPTTFRQALPKRALSCVLLPVGGCRGDMGTFPGRPSASALCSHSAAYVLSRSARSHY